MKRRVRWYSLSLAAGRIRALADRLLSESYADGKSQGFILDDVRARGIEGQHVQREDYEITGIDPLGRAFKREVTEYYQTRFRIDAAAPGLELFDAPRTAGTFLSRLAANLNFEAPIVPVEVDPLAWLDLVDREVRHVEVRQLEYADIVVGREISGLLRVSGPTDVRKAGSAIVGNRRHRVHRLAANLRIGTELLTCILDRNGRAGFEARFDDAVLPILRRTIASLAASASGGDG